jgi:hypothetical protein
MAKLCRRCGKEKPICEYYRDSNMSDGHLNICKSCVRARVSAYDKTEKGKAVERRRNQKPERKKKLYEQLVKWRKNNPDKTKAQRQRYPEKVRARNSLYKAIRRGEIVKGVCEVCGSEKVHAHHEDYDKPFEVRWFCAKHHYEHHHSKHMED